MQKNKNENEEVDVCLTVFFDAPFYVAVYERKTDGQLRVAKAVFGAQPREADVLDFVLHRLSSLPLSRPHDANTPAPSIKNPKRRQRENRRAMQEQGVGKRSWQALSAQREEHKLAKKSKRSQLRREEQEAAFALRQKKRKEKHRGR